MNQHINALGKAFFSVWTCKLYQGIENGDCSIVTEYNNVKLNQPEEQTPSYIVNKKCYGQC